MSVSARAQTRTLNSILLAAVLFSYLQDKSRIQISTQTKIIPWNSYTTLRSNLDFFLHWTLFVFLVTSNTFCHSAWNPLSWFCQLVWLLPGPEPSVLGCVLTLSHWLIRLLHWELPGRTQGARGWNGEAPQEGFLLLSQCRASKSALVLGVAHSLCSHE